MGAKWPFLLQKWHTHRRWAWDPVRRRRWDNSLPLSQATGHRLLGPRTMRHLRVPPSRNSRKGLRDRILFGEQALLVVHGLNRIISTESCSKFATNLGIAYTDHGMSDVSQSGCEKLIALSMSNFSKVSSSCLAFTTFFCIHDDGRRRLSSPRTSMSITFQS